MRPACSTRSAMPTSSMMPPAACANAPAPACPATKRAMLAPLKDRGILIRAEDEASESESALRLALRNARQAQRRAATRGARDVMALTNEIKRHTEANHQLHSQI